MTQDEIIRMARDAISNTINQHDQMLKRLWCIAYEEGQKAEREACAKVCEEMIASVITKPMPLRDIVTAIRARGEK